MTDSADNAPVRDEQGRFLPGNPLWELNPFKLDNPGRRNKYTPGQMRNRVAEYLDACAPTEDKPDGVIPTWAGLAVSLGMSRVGLQRYRAGEFGKTEDDKRAYVAVLEVFDSHVEHLVSGQLARTGSTSGLQFYLTNRYPGTWKNEKHVVSTGTQDTRLRVTLDADLAARLDDDASVIEGESTDVTPGRLA